MADNDFYGKSLFNEAGFVIQRLNKLQDRINMVRTNPLLFNPEMNVYNYQVWFSDLCSLMNEVWGKLTDDEKNKFNETRKTLKKGFRILPVHNKVTFADKNISYLKVDEDIWNLIEDNLDSLEKEIRESLEKHGLGNPDVEGDMF